MHATIRQNRIQALCCRPARRRSFPDRQLIVSSDYTPDGNRNRSFQKEVSGSVHSALTQRIESAMFVRIEVSNHASSTSLGHQSHHIYPSTPDSSKQAAKFRDRELGIVVMSSIPPKCRVITSFQHPVTKEISEASCNKQMWAATSGSRLAESH